jgi:hypothetical protein
MRLNFHPRCFLASLTHMRIRGAFSCFVLRTAGILLLAGSLACSNTSLKNPSDAGSDGSSSPGGGTGGVLGSGGAPGSGGRPGSGGAIGSGGGPGSGGVPDTGGSPGSGGGPGTGGSPGSAGGPGTGGAPGTGGSPGSAGGPGTGGAPGTGGNTGSDGGRDAPAAPDASPEVLRADGSPADRADAAMVSTIDASGGATDTRGTDALSPGAQEYVNTYLQPYCTRLAQCCAQAGIPSSGTGPCESYELGFVKYLNDGSAVIVPSVIQTLLSQINSSCDQPSYALIGATTDGTRTSGQPCVAPDQCAGTPALCLNGTCMTPPRGKAGDGCSVTCDDTTVCKWGVSSGKSPYSVCYDQDGLRCDSTTNTCVPVSAVGAACPAYPECGAHAQCTNGTCRALARVGQDCGSGQRCGPSLQCVSNASGTTETCRTLSLAWSGSCSP